MSAFTEWWEDTYEGPAPRGCSIDAAFNAGLEAAAKAAEETAQRIVHVNAVDAMGAMAVTCKTCAKNIRALKDAP